MSIVEPKTNNSILSLDIEKLKDGNKEAFEMLFRKYFKALVLFAVRFVGDTQKAEDIVQDVFVKIWKSHDNLDNISNIKTYLYSATRNTAINQVNKKKTEQKYFESLLIVDKAYASSPEEEIIYKEIRKKIIASIESLPEKRRIIFTMHRFDNLSYKEISEILDISINTVETQMSRALKHLRKQLVQFMQFI